MQHKYAEGRAGEVTTEQVGTDRPVILFAGALKPPREATPRPILTRCGYPTSRGYAWPPDNRSKFDHVCTVNVENRFDSDYF